MARLILEEGGATRRFKLSSGKLTFGSGDKATLTLASDDVAELHGQIEMSPDGAVLRTAKGVMPAKVGGRPVSGPHTLKEGQPVAVGSAIIRVEYDEGEGPPKPVAARGAAGSSSGRGAGGRTRGASGSRRRSRDGDEEDGRRPRPQRKNTGFPAWATALIVLVVIVGAAAGLLKMVGDSGFDFDARYRRYQREIKTEPVAARALLRSLLDEELTPEQRRLVETELENTAEVVEDIDDVKRNADIAKWLESRIFSYADKFAVTKERPHARLFLKRSSWFLSEYPTHPEKARVERLVERVTPVAELGDPPTFDDVKREVWGEVDYSPKDFTEAIKAIDKFIAQTTDAAGREQAQQLRTETLATEAEFYEQKKSEAAVVYDRKNYPDKYDPRIAFNDMVTAVTALYTPELRADAAKRMLGISEIKPDYYEAYKRDRPRKWASMMTEPSLKAFAEENGLL